MYLITRKEIVEGAVMPKGYAIAYVSDTIDGYICYPVGLHLVARWSRAFWSWLVRYKSDANEMKAMMRVQEVLAREGKVKQEEYARGYEEAVHKFLHIAGMVGVRDAEKVRELTELPDKSKVLRFKKGHKFSVVDQKTAITRHYEVEDVVALHSGLSIDARETGCEKGETMDEVVKKFKRGNMRGGKNV